MLENPRGLGRPLAPGWVARTQLAAALGLGLISLLAWLVPIVGLPVSITGLLLALAARSSRHRPGKTRYAMGLCLIGLALSVLALFLGIPLWPTFGTTPPPAG